MTLDRPISAFDPGLNPHQGIAFLSPWHHDPDDSRYVVPPEWRDFLAQHQYAWALASHLADQGKIDRTHSMHAFPMLLRAPDDNGNGRAAIVEDYVHQVIGNEPIALAKIFNVTHIPQWRVVIPNRDGGPESYGIILNVKLNEHGQPRSVNWGTHNGLFDVALGPIHWQGEVVSIVAKGQFPGDPAAVPLRRYYPEFTWITNHHTEVVHGQLCLQVRTPVQQENGSWRDETRYLPMLTEDELSEPGGLQAWQGTPKRARKAEHVQIKAEDVLLCDRCGTRFKIDAPCQIDMYLAITGAFLRLHRNCES